MTRHATLFVLCFALAAFAGHPENGKHLEKYPNGKKKLEGVYKNGKKEGTWTWHYKSGRVKTKRQYVADKKQGTERLYTEEGKLKEQTTWRADERHGSHKSQMWGVENGVPKLAWTTTGRYRYGKKDGQWVTKFANGDVHKKSYLRGKLVQ